MKSLSHFEINHPDATEKFVKFYMDIYQILRHIWLHSETYLEFQNNFFQIAI